jgi:hypothetical protein
MNSPTLSDRSRAGLVVYIKSIMCTSYLAWLYVDKKQPYGLKILYTLDFAVKGLRRDAQFLYREFEVDISITYKVFSINF